MEALKIRFEFPLFPRCIIFFEILMYVCTKFRKFVSEEIGQCPKCFGMMFREQGETITWFCPTCNLKFKTE